MCGVFASRRLHAASLHGQIYSDAGLMHRKSSDHYLAVLISSASAESLQLRPVAHWQSQFAVMYI